ncbi:MAG: UDP-N-acetylglucosamine--N-acetylmuramyl-(pentapeptide) pyrophosphoryl-undecaprenol N-acetylglucosamine transferase [Brevinema sp.]
MKIIISGGGTGGHLVPGVAIYQELKKTGNEVFYIMSERDKAYDISELLDNRFCISLSGISRKISWTTFKQIYSIFQAWRKSYQTIKQFNPDVVVITGGYLSNIAALSALLMRKPLYILEQNSVAGVTNRFWALFAKKIFTAIPSPKFIPTHKQVFTGNPLCFPQCLPETEAKLILGLTPNDKPVLGISGGSQGAQKINDMVLSIIPHLMDAGYQIVWSLGTKEFDRLDGQKISTRFARYGDDLKVFRFINRMDAFWSASNLVLARSGAGTVSEALYFRVPTLFIPIYHSPDNHQFLNAKFLANQHCAMILEEPQLTEASLSEMIDLMIDRQLEYRQNFPVKTHHATQQIANYLNHL